MTGPTTDLRYQLNGSTRICAVIGDPVGHSLSPTLHNAGYAALGLDWAYVAFPVRRHEANGAVDAMRTLQLAGLSVTMPHKDTIARFADEVSDDVALLGAGNTLRWLGNRIRAETTDGPGCIAALREAGADPDGKRVMVLGAGGAGRAVIHAAARAGAREVVVVNRSVERAEAAISLAGGVGRVGSVDQADSCDIIVNATSIGMRTGADRPGDPEWPTSVDVLPLDVSRVGPGQFVNDLIYHPRVTPLMSQAAQRGATVLGGVGMLLHQAALQFTFFTGEPAPLNAMQVALQQRLDER